MKLQKVTDPAFKKYGRVLKGFDFSELLDKMKETPCPADGTVYVASDAKLEALSVKKELQRAGYGELDIQIGYCNGNNYLLNALEYHRSSEMDIAQSDCILLLAPQQEVTADFSLDTAKVEAFFCPAGTGVELYATTMHFAPCNADDKGFRVVIVLPRDTNAPLEDTHGGDLEDKLITAKNKWLIAHPEADVNPASAHRGLKGENIDVRKLER